MVTVVHRIQRSLLFPILAFALVAAACGDDDTPDLSADADDPVVTEDSDTDTSDSGTDQDVVEEAIDELIGQGLSPEGAQCVIDDMLDNGITTDDLADLSSGVPDPAVENAAGDAGAACAALIGDDLPEEAFDLTNEVARRQFVRSFAATSGLSEQVADCVAQFFIDNDVDTQALLGGAASGELDPELEASVNEAVESCA